MGGRRSVRSQSVSAAASASHPFPRGPVQPRQLRDLADDLLAVALDHGVEIGMSRAVRFVTLTSTATGAVLALLFAVPLRCSAPSAAGSSARACCATRSCAPSGCIPTRCRTVFWLLPAMPSEGCFAMTLLAGTRQARICAALAALFLSTCAASAQDTRVDCVVEPAQKLKIGSATLGILKSVPVNRGAAVKAGDIIARLDSSVEEANVACRGRRRNRPPASRRSRPASNSTSAASNARTSSRRASSPRRSSIRSKPITRSAGATSRPRSSSTSSTASNSSAPRRSSNCE